VSRIAETLAAYAVSATTSVGKLTIMADSWNFLALTPEFNLSPRLSQVYYPEVFTNMLHGI
jgi:hypothetical protein